MGKRRSPRKKYPQINLGNGRIVLLHRHLMELHLGRKLTTDEVVHHINHDTQDYRFENLQIMSKRDHGRINPNIFKIGHHDNDPNVVDRKKQIEELRFIYGLSFGQIATVLEIHRGTVQYYLSRERVRESRRRRKEQQT